MAKATKITIEFDDGTKHTPDMKKTTSIFIGAEKAKGSGKKEPWKNPPEEGGTATTMAGECYIINGVVICY